jgi:sugar porter (SP) family MFS transporter
MLNDTLRENQTGSLVYLLKIAFVATIGGLLFGFDTAVIAGAQPFFRQYFEMSEAILGFSVAAAIIGCIPGAAFAGIFSDRFGRKNVLMACAVLFVVSAIWTGLATSLPEFVIARFVGGLGVGAASMLSPMYIAEVSPAHIRGRLVSLNQLAIVGGILVAYFSDYFLVHVDNNWRWMFAVETIPAVLFFFLLIMVPESPRWLIKQKREEDALSILTKVGGSIHARNEMTEIKEAVEQEQESMAQLFQPGLRLALIIGIFLAIFQQITGINVVIYYAPKIFSIAGSSIDSSLLQSVAVGGMNLVATLLAIYVIDKFGRKVLLITGSAGMAIFLVCLGASFQQDSQNVGLVLIFVLGYVGCFSASLGPVVWVVMSEIFPTRIRGRAMAIATVALWIACAVVAQVFPIMLESLDAMTTVGIFAVMCVINLLFTWKVIPETKGKSLEEIEKYWMEWASTSQ